MIEMLECTAPDGARTGARVARPPRTARGTLVLVHGVGSTAAIWDRQLAAFRDDYLCAAVELRGNGTLPDPNPGSITRQGYAADVLAVADALGAERFTIAGCSLGGVVAFELWQRAAWRIDAMFILGSFARYPDGQRYADSICAQARELGDVRAFGELRAAQLGLPPERLRETIDQYACKSLESFLAATQATWTGDYRATLGSIDVPVTVCYGAHDAVAPRPLAEEIASAIRGARLEEIPAAGHVANADNAPDFNRRLREFLAVLP